MNLYRLFLKKKHRHIENREGFYHLLDMEGTCESARSVSYIIRDHDFEKFKARKQFVCDPVKSFNQKYGDRFQLEMHDQYYNMIQFMHDDMRSVQKAKEALEACGLTRFLFLLVVEPMEPC